MAYPKQPDTCMYCPKPMARRENGRRRICQDCNRERKYLYQYGIDLIDYREMGESQGAYVEHVINPRLRCERMVQFVGFA